MSSGYNIELHQLIIVKAWFLDILFDYCEIFSSHSSFLAHFLLCCFAYFVVSSVVFPVACLNITINVIFFLKESPP